MVYGARCQARAGQSDESEIGQAYLDGLDLGELELGELRAMKKEIVSEQNEKPGFDEETLGRLLEAAYVLQEHSRRVREEMALHDQSSAIEVRSTPASIAIHAVQHVEKTPESIGPAQPAKDDYTLTLAQIVEVQHQIQLRRLALDDVVTLVAERASEIARAGGAAVGILSDQTVHYRAAWGSMNLPNGTAVPIEKALCAASLRTGQVIRSGNIDAEFLVDAAECRRRAIQSLIVVPVYHEGGVAGALELYYSSAQAFNEQDVHTCQLMAGLITEALARAEEQTWKQSLAEERAAMMEALEKLKPNLTALASGTLQESAPQTEVKTVESVSDGKSTEIEVSASTAALALPPVICHKCGNQLEGEEQFCGKCGLPRSSDYEPPSMQYKVASLWHMQEDAKRKKNLAGPEDKGDEDIDALVINEILSGKNLSETLLEGESQITTESAEQIEGADGVADAKENGSEEEASTDPKGASHWGSAASARDFFEQLATRPGALGRFWNARRGDIYLAIAVILVIGVIRWGIWSNHSVGASGGQPAKAAQSKPAAAPAPDSNLSMFDRMLISLGLADAPEPPESKGNPETQVWVDLQTALYYCPGTDLYGKTIKGKFSSQRDAQLDQFEPASRKTCN
jgi:GAF domain-containing protein